ncbi:hypothetical protein PR048_032114 [Dryococelus australis]|uniref:Uncharacterized protein n=1 Tax=Dryococelus australis TaxID=614101 RepID=A0ABQ9G1A7_9NEOP|nr:hypothetical protein PR048_032114 [Dryococelus australis]
MIECVSLLSAGTGNERACVCVVGRGGVMYESSCSYQSALDLKRVTAACPPAMPAIKSEDCMSVGVGGTGDWAGCAYRFACNSSTFEQLKQSVEKAKAALQDRGGYLAASSAFSDLASSSPFVPPARPTAAEDVVSSLADKRSEYVLRMRLCAAVVI